MKEYNIQNAAYGEENKHLGGYIQKVWFNYEKKYLTFGMKSFDSHSSQYINIMVFEENGANLNPNYSLIVDAYNMGKPVSCVYLKKSRCNVLKSVYVNFSEDQFKGPDEDNSSVDNNQIDSSGDLPF